MKSWKAIFRSLVQAGIPLSEEHKKTITNYCGRHPYLLSLLGYHLIEDYNGTIDVERAFHQVEERFSQSYDRIIDLVLVNDDNDEKLQKLWQILSGQTADIARAAGSIGTIFHMMNKVTLLLSLGRQIMAHLNNLQILTMSPIGLTSMR